MPPSGKRKKKTLSRGGVKPHKLKITESPESPIIQDPTRPPLGYVPKDNAGESFPIRPHIESVKEILAREAEGEGEDIRGEHYDLVEEGWTLVAVRTRKQGVALVEAPEGFIESNALWMFGLECLTRRIRKFEIKRLMFRFIEECGYKPSCLTPNKFTKIMDRARVELRVQTDIDREDHVAEGYETMRAIIADKNSDVSDKIKAQQVINDLLGLSARYNQQGDSNEDKVRKICNLLEDEMRSVREGQFDD